jgi:hypothetical protein
MEIIELIFRSFWSFAGSAIIIGAVLKTIMFMWNRLFRHMNIRKHGYPPSHCDADGDFKNK